MLALVSLLLAVGLLVAVVVGHSLAARLADERAAAARARAALARGERRWQTLVDHLPDTTVVVTDAHRRVEAVGGTGAMRERIGDGVGRPVEDVTGPEDGPVVRGLVEAALRGKEQHSQLGSGDEEHDLHALPLVDDDGGRGALLLARDMSRELAARRALVETAERAERIFTDGPVGIAVLTLGGDLVSANPALHELFYRAPGTLPGVHLSELSGDPDDPAVQRLLENLRWGQGNTRAEWTVRDANGDLRYLVLEGGLLVEGAGDEPLALVHVVDTTERRRYELRLAHLADHDPLTGLANRRRFDSELAAHLETCRRQGPSGALLMLDLDHFKEVNDTLGHTAGDELLVVVASLVREGLRTTDLVARLGGDEFAVLLPQAGREAAELVAAGIVDRVRTHARGLEGVSRKVTASIGVVMIDGRHSTTGELMASVDMMMYDAKEAGRDQHALLDRAHQAQPRIGARMAWNERIENAIENDGLVLHLQPILDLRTGTVTGAEALLRMVDGDTLVLPGRFLHIAEATGLVARLDTWVMRHAVELLARLQAVRPDFTLEVNLSGRSIGDPDLERALVAALAGHDVDPSGLVLEVTETAAVSNVQVARGFAERISALGCRFALDDFGAGFGSFYYLKHLMFDFVKIDGEFVSHSNANATDRAIMQSIVGITHGLGKRAVAEFVSDPEIFKVVLEEGVDLAQGYYIGRPMPVDVFLENLQTDRAPFDTPAG